MSSAGNEGNDLRKVSGFSFVSLPTSDQQLYDQTIEFYTQLGFVKFQQFDHSSAYTSTIKSESTHAKDSTQETWLVALPDAIFDPTATVERLNETGATIKVRLSSAGPSAKESAAKLANLRKIEGEEDWRSLSTSFVFSSSNIPDLVDSLKQVVKSDVYYAPVEASPVEAYAFDPLGNIVGFTSKKNPLTDNDNAPAPRFEGKALASMATSIAGSAYNGQDDNNGGSSSRGSPADPDGKKRRIGVMTSGGDAPGMNAVVRAVVRAAIHRGAEAYAIMEGYEGLVQGGSYIKEMSWDDVRGFLSIGGTMIGTARCAAFRERAGRLRAAHNMILAGIDALVVCGGDGSLTGADTFRAEWPSLIKELLDTGKITQEEVTGHEHLYICGLVGSIDNDMSSTDATIGAYSSLDRICEAVDYIDATAQSHSRAFVIEVMGRHCGWLALMAGLATSADYIFIPEQPPAHEEWSANMKKIVSRHREKGMRKTIVIVAEGAIDTGLKPITPEMVKDALVELGLDTRITTLGHVQRGGTAVAFDRMLATMQGVEAVEAILSLTPGTPSPMIGITENKVVRRDLMEAVALTGEVAKAIDNKDFDGAMDLRDSEFKEHLENFLTINSADNEIAKNPAEKKLKIAIINVGAPAGGMNAAIRAAACYCFSRGHTPYAIHNGFTGLARHESVREINWLDVEQWGSRGGCEIGTNRHTPDVDLGMVAFYFQKYAFDGLIIIGGFEAYHSLQILEQNKHAYPAFRIPMVCLPATISNNVPGTEYSLGTDTCLNSLVAYCDVVKQSASSTRRRVFVVEVQGGNSGYVASYAGLVTGAHVVYTPEEGISLRQLSSDIDYLKECFIHDQGRNRAGRLVLRNEKASNTFKTKTLTDILSNESDNRFEAREAIPGHVQQGGIPSPMDRVRATRLAIKCIKFMEDNQAKREEKDLDELGKMYSVIGIRSSHLVFTPIEHLWRFETEIDTRRPNKIHWTKMIDVCDMLAGRPKV